MALQNLYVTVPVGQSVRDFLIPGTVERLLDLLPEFRVVVLSPAYNVPEFRDLCPKHDRLVIRRMELPVGGANARLRHWRRKIQRRQVIKWMLKWEAHNFRLPHYLENTFSEFPPSLVVSTHPMPSYDYEVVTQARRLGVQTLGVVKSWDNVGKRLSSHCHLLSVWNPVNKMEALELLGYRPNEVMVNGAVSFDAYYSLAYEQAREEAMAALGLDPTRRVLTVATCGALEKGFYGRDETHLIDDVLDMMQKSETIRGSQLVIRLHPTSRLEYFWKYWGRPDIKLSFASVMPGIMWCPNREDLAEQVNLLRHSDVIITPGSSWVLEAAIFDRPTVVPVYSDRQPDHAAALFDRWTLARHYRPLVEKQYVQITRSYQQTRTAIEEALTSPQAHAAGRKAIVDQYVYHRDNRSGQRIAEWIADVARTIVPGKPRGF